MKINFDTSEGKILIDPAKVTQFSLVSINVTRIQFMDDNGEDEIYADVNCDFYRVCQCVIFGGGRDISGK